MGIDAFPENIGEGSIVHMSIDTRNLPTNKVVEAVTSAKDSDAVKLLAERGAKVIITDHRIQFSVLPALSNNDVLVIEVDESSNDEFVDKVRTQFDEMGINVKVIPSSVKISIDTIEKS